jgi:hypothetical protein
MRAGGPTSATKLWAYSDSNSDPGISSASCTQRLVAANFPSKGSLKSWAELGVGSTFRYTGANYNARVLNYLTRFSCTLTTHLLLAHPIPVTFSPFFSKPYLVGINSRILLTTHSQKNQEKISLTPPIQSDCGRYLLTCLFPKLFIIRLKPNKINSSRVAVHHTLPINLITHLWHRKS